MAWWLFCGPRNGLNIGPEHRRRQEVSRVAVLQYREVLKDFTTVLTAAVGASERAGQSGCTLGNISSSLVGVYRALGGGWEIREGKDLVPLEVQEAMAKRTNWGGLLTPASYNPSPSAEAEPGTRLPDW
jgi:hypothetical protein